MADRFRKLLHRYKNNVATPAERSELLALFKTGKFNHLLEEEMRETFASETEITDLEQRSLEKIRRRFDAMPRPDTKVVSFNRPVIWLAAAAVVALAVVATVLITNVEVMNNTSASQQMSVNRKTYSGKQYLMLPDGTQVILNEGSELTFDPATYGESKREVTLDGEGFFDVTHDPSRQFVVKTGNVFTKVLGTAFNISAYPLKREITVTVVRGLVEVGDEQHVYGKIKLNEEIKVDVASKDFVKRDTQSEDAISWQEKFFVLDNVTFSDAAKIIEKRFNVNVTIENKSLEDCKVIASFFNNEGLEQIIEGLSIIRNATPEINGDSVIIRGGTGCK